MPWSPHIPKTQQAASQNIQVVMEMSNDLSRWQTIQVEQLPRHLRYDLPSES